MCLVRGCLLGRWRVRKLRTWSRIPAPPHTPRCGGCWTSESTRSQSTSSAKHRLCCFSGEENAPLLQNSDLHLQSRQIKIRTYWSIRYMRYLNASWNSTENTSPNANWSLQTNENMLHIFEPWLITDDFDYLNFRFTSEVRQQTTISMIVGAIAARKMHCKRFEG